MKSPKLPATSLHQRWERRNADYGVAGNWPVVLCDGVTRATGVWILRDALLYIYIRTRWTYSYLLAPWHGKRKNAAAAISAKRRSLPATSNKTAARIATTTTRWWSSAAFLCDIHYYNTSARLSGNVLMSPRQRLLSAIVGTAERYNRCSTHWNYVQLKCNGSPFLNYHTLHNLTVIFLYRAF